MSPAFHSFSRFALAARSCFSLSRSEAAFSKSCEVDRGLLVAADAGDLLVELAQVGGAVIRRMRIREPASSIRSIALSGRKRSKM
ncbi:hypothetical protein SALBM217S_09308 [Streptomyces griseoloalbus]